MFLKKQIILTNFDFAVARPNYLGRFEGAACSSWRFAGHAAGKEELKDLEAWRRRAFSDGLVGVVRHRSTTLCPGIVLTPLVLFQFYVTKTNCWPAIVPLFRSNVCSSRNLVFLNFHWTFDRHIRRRGERTTIERRAAGKGVGTSYALNFVAFCVACS